MLTTDNAMVIELHSEQCLCHGYGWRARAEGRPVPVSFCGERHGRPDGAIWVDSARWRELGMPRTAEQYCRAELEYGNVIVVGDDEVGAPTA
jgi:hypothetical protein